MRLSASLAILLGLASVVPAAAAPSLAVNPTTAAPGQSLAVIVSDGPANRTDWVGLYAASAADTSPLSWQYLNGTRTAPSSGVATATLTFAAPAAGTYNFRFFASDGYARLATSANLTVQPASGPTLSLNPTTAAPGQIVTVTVAGAEGNRTDWIGSYSTSGNDLQILDWMYLNGARTPPASGLTATTLSFAAPQTPGSYDFRLFRADTYAKLATSPALTVQAGASPTLSVSPTTVNGGQSVTVTLANGPGNSTDWVALFPAAAADSGYIQWRYLNGQQTPPATGPTSATLTFAMPTTAGGYNFRLFRANTYTKLATSAGVTVQGSTGGATLSVNLTSTPPGGPVTVSVANGPGNTTDWVGLYATAAPDASFLAWRYLNGLTTPPASGMTAATLTFTMPNVPGTYNFRFFRANGTTRLATSPIVTVGAGPTLSATPSVVTSGGTVTVTFGNGTGDTRDWIGVHRVGARDTEILDWKYLNNSKSIPSAPITSGQVSFALSFAQGDYDFRFFRGSNNQRLAITPAVSVRADSSISVSATTVAPGQNVTVTIRSGSGNATDWVGMFSTAGPDTTPIAWHYLNGTKVPPGTPILEATLTFRLPTTPGTYNFRLFRANTYERLATSPTVTVLANTATISVDDVSVTEGNSGTTQVRFTVSLSAASTQTVSVDFVTTNGTASAGSDYVAGAGRITFPAGSTSQPLAITVNGDTDIEPDETFFVNLSGATLATIADAQGRATIVSDDQGAPGRPVLIAPSGTINTATPTYQWNALASVDQYFLSVVRNSGSVVYQQLYQAAAVCSGNTCSAMPTQALGEGPHRWMLQARNALGSGPFSAALNFNVQTATTSVITISSHDDGQRIDARGAIVSGMAQATGGVTSLTATLSDPLLGITVNARPLDVSPSGRWAFWIHAGEISAGETIAITFTATHGGGQTATAALGLQVVAVDLRAEQLLNRTTFGASPALLPEIAAIGAASYQAEQLDPLALDDSVLDARVASMPRTTKAELQAYTMTRMAFSRRQLQEVLAQFWDNHFNTDINKPTSVASELAEYELFRQNALGRFRDLLEISATSPAMLLYLDNAASVKADPNENYARELMELHTLGVNGGYTQNDVVQVAKAFTGWTVQNGQFVFDAAEHDTTQKLVLGQTLPAGRGIEDGRDVLDILAAHPSAARFICTKLAQLLVTDAPTTTLVDQCAASFNATGGLIAAVVRTLLDSGDFVAAPNFRAKVKTPIELVVGAVRNLNATTTGADLAGAMVDMGLRLYENPVPTGWSETGDDWISAATLLERIAWVNDLARRSAGSAPTTVDLRGYFVASGYETAEGIVGFLFQVAHQREYSDLDRQVALDILSPPGGPAFDINATDAIAKLQRLVGTVLSYPGYQAH